MAARDAVTTPASDPNVPGALGMYPIPSTEATANASRGFSRETSNARAALGFVVISFIEIEQDRLALAFRGLFFVEYRVGNYVLFARPVAQVPHPATLAAKRKVFMYLRVRLRLANGTLVFHLRFQPNPERGAALLSQFYEASPWVEPAASAQSEDPL